MSWAYRLARGRARLAALIGAGLRYDQHLDDIRIAQGRILSTLNAPKDSTNLRDYEFKVFSQWGEDGIIQKLIESIAIPSKTFIEFGVEDFLESNCRFLMMKDNWSGLVIDGSVRNINRIRQSHYYWKYELSAVQAFISRENIDAVISSAGYSGDVGILSIDIDGVDYFVWEAINSISPAIVIAEYNSLFGPSRPVSVPYDPMFQRGNKHYSNLYFGSSIAALAHLGERLGYCLVGGTSQGVNAFFVRSDLMTDRLRAVSAADAYAPSRFRESRGPNGAPTYLDGDDRLATIRGQPVVNVVTGEAETL